MFGKKENDGFLDGMARSLANVAITWVVIFSFWYSIKDFYTAIITFNVRKLTMYAIGITFFALLIHFMQQHKKDFKSRPNRTIKVDYLGV